MEKVNESKFDNSILWRFLDRKGRPLYVAFFADEQGWSQVF